MRWHGFLWAAVVVALGAAPAAGDVVSIPASQDNTIFSEDADASNGAGDHFFAGATNEDFLRRGLIAFDVAGSVPAGATINSVTLTLYMSRARSQDEDVSLHRVITDWGEGASDASGEEGTGASALDDDATWDYARYDEGNPPGSPAWTSLGGDYIASASATTAVGRQSGFFSWSSAGLVTDVQDWLDGTEPDYGWIVLGNETGTKVAKRFDSRTNPNSAQRPELVVDFTSTAATGACCATDGSCSVVLDPGGSCSGSYQGSGSVCEPNSCPQPTGACCTADASATCNETTAAACAGSYQGDFSTCASTECPVIPTPFEDALPIPGAATPVSGSSGGEATYNIAMREVQQNLHNELPDTTVWGYGDGLTGASYPGSTIEATTDLPVTVNWINDLRDTSQMGDPLRTSHYLPVDTCPHGADDQSPRTVVHLHGGHVPAAVDGHPEATFTPGNQVQYVYPNNQLPSTLWFHDHALGITRLNVYMGMAAFYLIRDAVENALGLPSGEYEIPLAIQDRSFNVDGTWKYPATWEDTFFGETMLVNGKVWPVLSNVKQGLYRLRLLNGCNSRTLNLEFCPNSSTAPCPAPATFQLLGQEGGLLGAPVSLTEINLGPAERADVVVDFGAYTDGTEVYLVNSEVPNVGGAPDVPDVMKFVVGSTVGHTTPVPSTLRTLEVLDENDSVVDRTFELAKGPPDLCSDFAWEVVTTDGLNGSVLGSRWDDVTEYPERGTTEIWSFINRSGMMHPMHMHLVMFQVLDRQDFDDSSGNVVPIGSPVPPPTYEAGWKDTVQVPPGQIVRVIARFDDYTGLFPYHCHIIEHEDHEMMREFQVVSCGNGDLEPTEECDDGNTVAGDGCYPTCELEDQVDFYGVGEGGAVEITVSGVLLSVPTSPGDDPVAVASAVAAAINADSTLQGLGITAVAIANGVVTNGSIDSVMITDPGLRTAPEGVPALSPGGLTGLLVLLLATAALTLRTGRANPS